MQINVNKARLTLRDAKGMVKRRMVKETQALSAGIFLAMSNANKRKGKGTRPKRLRQGGNWFEGGAELQAITGDKDNPTYTPIDVWINRLKTKNRTATYTDKKGRTRKKKVSGFKLTTERPKYVAARKKRGGMMVDTYEIQKPQDLRTKDIWRRGSTGSVPFSWGGYGLANYFLREQWRSRVAGLAAQVRISPAKFRGESDNERVLRLLDVGGQGQGSRKLIGYRLHFIHKRTDPKDVTSIWAQRVYTDTKPTIHLRGFRLKDKAVERINAVLKTGVPPSRISKNRWRNLGAGY